ncbi:MAG: 30S ribosomal protein S6e [Candidatus Altiarchaeales archaeon]|nr:MAG: 30S ribosomal protein S6e [Candidatus Altiarchaeales archaeon]
MEYKIVISDPKTGKSYQYDVKDEKAKRFNGMKIGDIFDGSILGMSGYKLQITGGSDISGFPMKKGIKGSKKLRILMKGGSGYRPKGVVRKRKTVKGEVIDENIVQINTKVIKTGSKSIESLLGIDKEKSNEKV